MVEKTFIILSQEKAKEFVTDLPYLHISVRDPGDVPVETLTNPNMVARLDLEFSDFDVDINPKILETNIKVFTKEDAQSILKVFSLTEKYISLVVINCVAGISRSAAIAAALTKLLGQDDSSYFKRYCPNRYVYRTIINLGMDSRPIGE